jgi:hypothetical protein
MDLDYKIETGMRDALMEAHLPEISKEGVFRLEEEKVITDNGRLENVLLPILSLDNFPLPIDCPVYFETSRKSCFLYPGTGILFKTGHVGIGFRHPISEFNIVSEEQKRYSNLLARSEYAFNSLETREGIPRVRQIGLIECRYNGNLFLAEELGDSLLEVADRFAKHKDIYNHEREATFNALTELSSKLSGLGLGYESALNFEDPKEILHRLIRFDLGMGNYEIRITSNPSFKENASRRDVMIAHSAIYDAFVNRMHQVEKGKK